MAPSTPPPPSSERLAAFTIASTSSVVISATTTSITAWPISAVSSVMDVLSCRDGLGRHLKVDSRAYTDVIIVRVEKTASGAPTMSAQHFEEVVVGVETVGHIQGLRCAGQCNPVNIDTPVQSGPRAARQLSLVDQLADECNSMQLRHQRGIECDLVYPREDLRLCFRYLLALQWIDLDQQQIFRVRGAHQRVERRVAHVTTVPINLAFDLDCTEQVRKTGGRDDHVCGHFLAPEYMQFPALHIGRGHEQLHVLI